jgi:glycine/serine hydroxymethyltransferase
MDRQKDGAEVPDKLEQANVIVDRGIRLGTSEMTRRGMREDDMNEVAEIIAKVIHGQETPHAAKRKAIALARKFRRVHYA